YADVETSVVVKPNASADVGVSPVKAEPKTPTDWRKVGGIVGLGVGVASGVVGLIGTLQVNSINHDPDYVAFRMANSHSPNVCATAKDPGPMQNAHVADLCDKGSTYETMQLITFPAAAVIGGIGLYFLATSGTREEKPKQSLVVEPSVGLTS